MSRSATDNAGGRGFQACAGAASGMGGAAEKHAADTIGTTERHMADAIGAADGHTANAIGAADGHTANAIGAAGEHTAEGRAAVTVVKVGGGVLEDRDAQADFLREFAAMPGAKVLVHGGGREATSLAARIGIEAHMVEGRRITDAAMLEIVTMVYGGLVNKRLVAGLQGLGLNAMGLTGADLRCVMAHRRPVRDGLDFGYVGDIDSVDADALASLLRGGIVPVMAPLSFDGETLLNTNADTIASCTATALAGQLRVSLTYCFEKEGVLDAGGAVIERLDKPLYEALKAGGTVSAGMIPKLDNAFAAIGKGVEAVRITSFRALSGGTLICP